MGIFHWQIALYLAVWLLQAAGYVVAYKRLAVGKAGMTVLYWLPKVRLVVFNMVLLDFGFYATHAAMHFNYFPSSQLAMLCLTLLVLDILEMVDICSNSNNWHLFYTSTKPKDQSKISQQEKPLREA